jgi:hypothetical protein
MRLILRAMLEGEPIPELLEKIDSLSPAELEKLNSRLMWEKAPPVSKDIKLKLQALRGFFFQNQQEYLDYASACDFTVKEETADGDVFLVACDNLGAVVGEFNVSRKRGKLFAKSEYYEKFATWPSY